MTKILTLLLFICVSTMAVSQNTDTLRIKEIRENGLAQTWSGVYIHALSFVFLTKGITSSNTRMPFVYINVFALHIDVIGIYNISRAKKLKRKMRC